MATTIKLKNSVTTTNAPSSLVQGEVAINITDKKVWVGNAATTPIQLLGDGGSGSFTSIAFGAGTVSNPSITFTGDTNTGIYSPAADTIAFTEGGVESMRIDSSGNVGIGTSSPATYGDLAVYKSNSVNSTIAVSQGTATTNYGSKFSAQYGSTEISSYGWYWTGSGFVSKAGLYGTLTFNDLSASNAERMRIDSSGNVLVGGTSSVYNFSGRGVVEVNGSSQSFYGLTIGGSGKGYLAHFGTDMDLWNSANGFIRFATNATERMRITSGGDVGIGTSSPAERLDVQGTGDIKARIYTTGATLGTHAGLFLKTGSYEYIIQNFTTTAGSAGALRFYDITANTERMRITSSGNLLVGTTTNNASGGVIQVSNGITFPATQSASSDANTLDDYEEGTWTPTIIGSTSAGTASYTSQVGKYTKIGNRVYINCRVEWSSGTGTGTLRITGLPFSVSSATDDFGVMATYAQNITLSANNYCVALAIYNTTRIDINQNVVGGGADANVNYDASGGLILSGFYNV